MPVTNFDFNKMTISTQHTRSDFESTLYLSPSRPIKITDVNTKMILLERNQWEQNNIPAVQAQLHKQSNTFHHKWKPHPTIIGKTRVIREEHFHSDHTGRRQVPLHFTRVTAPPQKLHTIREPIKVYEIALGLKALLRSWWIVKRRSYNQ